MIFGFDPAGAFDEAASYKSVSIHSPFCITTNVGCGYDDAYGSCKTGARILELGVIEGRALVVSRMYAYGRSRAS